MRKFLEGGYGTVHRKSKTQVDIDLFPFQVPNFQRTICHHILQQSPGHVSRMAPDKGNDNNDNNNAAGLCPAYPNARLGPPNETVRRTKTTTTTTTTTTPKGLPRYGSRQVPAHLHGCYLCIIMGPPDPRASTLAHLSCSHIHLVDVGLKGCAMRLHPARVQPSFFFGSFTKKKKDGDEPSKNKEGGWTLSGSQNTHTFIIISINHQSSVISDQSSIIITAAAAYFFLKPS